MTPAELLALIEHQDLEVWRVDRHSAGDHRWRVKKHKGVDLVALCAGCLSGEGDSLESAVLDLLSHYPEVPLAPSP